MGKRLWAVAGAFLAAFAVRANDLVKNASFEEPSILLSGQTEVGPGESKLIVLSAGHDLFPWGIGGVRGWENAVNPDQVSDQGISRLIELPAVDGSRSAFINNWNRRFSQTMSHNVLPGDRYRVTAWVGSREAVARCGRITLIAGRMDSNNRDELEPGALILGEVTAGTQWWTQFQPTHVIQGVGWTRVQFDVQAPASGPALGRPLTISLRTEGPSVGQVFFDAVGVEIIGGPAKGEDDYYEAASGARIQGSVLDNDYVSSTVEIVSPPRHAAFFSPPAPGETPEFPDLFAYESLPGFVGEDSFRYRFQGYGGIVQYATCRIRVDAPGNLSLYAAPDVFHRATASRGQDFGSIYYYVEAGHNDRFPAGTWLNLALGTGFSGPAANSLELEGPGIVDLPSGYYDGAESGQISYLYYLLAPDGRKSNVASGIVHIGWPYLQVAATLPNKVIDDLRVQPLPTWAGYRLDAGRRRATVSEHASDLPTPAAHDAMATGYVRTSQFRHAVGWYEDVAGLRFPYQWTWTGASVHGGALPTLGGAQGAAEDINMSRVIAGWAQDPSGRKRPVIWTRDGMRDLGTFGGPNGTALSINDEGTVVGWAEQISGRAVAFVWTPQHGLVGLQTPTDYSSEARDASGGSVFGVLRDQLGRTTFARWDNGVLQPPPNFVPGSLASEWHDSGFGTVRTSARTYAVWGSGVFEGQVRDASYTPVGDRYDEGLQADGFWRSFAGPVGYFVRNEWYAILKTVAGQPTTVIVHYVQPPWTQIDRQQGIGDPFITSTDADATQVTLAYEVRWIAQRVELAVVSGAQATTFTTREYFNILPGPYSETIHLLDVDAPTEIGIRARLYEGAGSPPEGGGVARFLVQPRLRTVANLSVGPPTTGTQRVATVTINRKLDLVDTMVELDFDAPFGSAPGWVLVPAGQTSASFPIDTGPAAPGGTVTLTARLNGSSRAVPIAVPNAAVLRGTLDLQGWVAPTEGLPVRVTLWNLDTSASNVFSVSLDAQSRCLVPAPPGRYLVWAWTPRFLQRRAGPVIVGPSLTEVGISLLGGDCDEDNDVDIDDFLILAAAYETQVGEPSFAEGADLNGDEAVNLDDYLILAANYERVGDRVDTGSGEP